MAVYQTAPVPQEIVQQRLRAILDDEDRCRHNTTSIHPHSFMLQDAMVSFTESIGLRCLERQ